MRAVIATAHPIAAPPAMARVQLDRRYWRFFGLFAPNAGQRRVTLGGGLRPARQP
jgi:hypothetical protein